MVSQVESKDKEQKKFFFFLSAQHFMKPFGDNIMTMTFHATLSSLVKVGFAGA